MSDLEMTVVSPKVNIGQRCVRQTECVSVYVLRVLLCALHTWTLNRINPERHEIIVCDV